jgi:hypothetical protein
VLETVQCDQNAGNAEFLDPERLGTIQHDPFLSTLWIYLHVPTTIQGMHQLLHIGEVHAKSLDKFVLSIDLNPQNKQDKFAKCEAICIKTAIILHHSKGLSTYESSPSMQLV